MFPRVTFKDKSTYIESSTKVYDDVSQGWGGEGECWGWHRVAKPGSGQPLAWPNTLTHLSSLRLPQFPWDSPGAGQAVKWATGTAYPLLGLRFGNRESAGLGLWHVAG